MKNQDIFKEWIEELFECELTNFINTLIKDDNIQRHMIYYGYDDNIKPQNRDNLQWFLINDFFETDEMVDELLKYDITHMIFGNRLFVAIITPQENLYDDIYWNKLYKELFLS